MWDTLAQRQEQQQAINTSKVDQGWFWQSHASKKAAIIICNYGCEIVCIQESVSYCLATYSKDNNSGRLWPFNCMVESQ